MFILKNYLFLTNLFKIILYIYLNRKITLIFPNNSIYINKLVNKYISYYYNFNINN